MKMYDELADWFHLLTAPEDYLQTGTVAREAILSIAPGARTLLELGSGGGNHASHMKHWFELTLTDLSPAMLALSRTINPEVEHIEGDMRTLRLGRTFDAVFAHDAIEYMTTEADLAAAIATAVAHTRPGGAALFMPDCTRQSFRESTDHGGHDGDGRALRYLEWTTDPDPADTCYDVDYAFVLHEEGHEPVVELDHHVCGVFPRETWLRLLREAGFEPEWRTYTLEDEPGVEYELFVARRVGA